MGPVSCILPTVNIGYVSTGESPWSDLYRIFCVSNCGV